MAPFFIATAVTYYLVSKAQEAGINCAFSLSSPLSLRWLTRFGFAFVAAEEHRNSPKNPYAAQIAAAKGHH
jgi:N-acetylglutamate synthase-like GNAT family acetyltransferase